MMQTAYDVSDDQLDALMERHAERMAEMQEMGEVRPAAAPRITMQAIETMTPLMLAKEIRGGLTLSDFDIRRLQQSRGDLWAVAVDDDIRERTLHPKQSGAYSSSASAGSQNMGAGFARLERILCAPVKPVLDARGNFIGATREIPADLDELPPIEAPRQVRQAAPAKKEDRRGSGRPVTERTLFAMIDMLMPIIKEERDAINELTERANEQQESLKMAAETLTAQNNTIADLQAQIAELQARAYQGVWSETDEYSPSMTVTLGGALWFCRSATSERPGSSSDWQLMTKTR